MIGRLTHWFDVRLGAARFVHGKLNYVFPRHWSFLIGEVALYSFVVLAITGTFLAFFYTPSTAEVVYDGSYAPLRGTKVSEAYASALRLSFDVRAGLLLRQIHHWAALTFVAAIVAHLARVFFTAAYRRPREINWIVGVTLLVLALANGYTGYSLLDDLLSGTGLRIGYSIVLSIPVVGSWLAFLFFGGEFPAAEMLSRLFVVHVYLVPALLAGLITVHLAIVFRQHHTQFPGPGRTEGNIVGERMWPAYVVKSLGLFFLVFAVLTALGGLAQINPVWLYGPFEPAVVTTASQPDWYFGWLEGALRLFPPWELSMAGYHVPNPFFPGVVLPALTFGLLYLWPFLEARLTGDRDEHHLLERPRDCPPRVAAGVALLTFYAVLLIAGANDVLASILRLPIIEVVWALRILVVGAPPLAGLIAYRLARDLAAASLLPEGDQSRDSR